jgi:hypothetical protein
MDLQSRNLTVPRGTALFAKYKPGTQIPGPFRELGNTPEFTLAREADLICCAPMTVEADGCTFEK